METVYPFAQGRKVGYEVLYVDPPTETGDLPQIREHVAAGFVSALRVEAAQMERHRA